MTHPATPPTKEEAKRTRVRAARTLGSRLDGFTAAIGRTPRLIIYLALAAILFATFPREVHPSSFVGLQIDTTIGAWLVNLVEVALGVVVLWGLFYLFRSIVALIEAGRWATKAGGTETETVDALDESAENLSSSADTIRYLRRRLKEADSTIRLLSGELEKLRGVEPQQQEGQQRRRTGGEQ